jgi:putative addiction module killer protein
MQVRLTIEFARWRDDLRDGLAKARIAKRIERVERGLLGDVKPVGQSVSEMRIDYGPGYRVYFMQRGDILVILLCGGTKASQQRDIARAWELAAEWEDE